jgi:hypothetical protein
MVNLASNLAGTVSATGKILKREIVPPAILSSR